jgi:hypothetical protein
LLSLWKLAGSPRGAELDTIAVLQDNLNRMAGQRVPTLR